MLIKPSATSIRRLKVTTNHKNDASLKRRVSQRLQSVGFEPAGLAPSAVFMIKHVEDPLPGLVGAPEAERWSKWSCALQNRLNKIYRGAHRPKNAIVKADANAIVFRDPTQLVTCVCRDIAAGTLANQWWWNKTFSSINLSVRLRESLLEEPALTPAVFTVLAEAGSALAVVSKLANGDATRIAEAMLLAHDCQSLAAAIDGAELFLWLNDSDGVGSGEFSESQLSNFQDCSSNSGKGSSSITQQSSVNERAKPLHEPVTAPPWQAFFAHDIWRRDLTKAQALLLGMSRCLYSYPVVSRSTAFQKQVTRWLSPAAAEPNHHSESMVASSGGGRRGGTDIDAGSSIVPLNSGVRAGQSTSDEGAEGQSSLETKRDFGFDLPADSHLAGDDAAAFSEHTTKNTAGRHQPACESKTAPADDAQREAIDTASCLYSDTAIDTEWAGALYVINLLNQLQPHRYYGDLWDFESQLSHWAFLQAIAVALLSESGSAVKDDPLWNLLATLDNRRLSKKGINYRGGHDYIIPLQWFDAAAFSDEPTFVWAHTETRLRLWVDEFALVDCLLSTGQDAESVAQQYAQYYRPNAKLVGARFGSAPIDKISYLIQQGLSEDLSRWLALVAPYLRRYLQKALALPNAAPDTVVEKLFKMDGRIFVSSSHIDLVTSINNVCIAKRRAGLDQNPGWLPDYGRVVFFHFSQAEGR